MGYYDINAKRKIEICNLNIHKHPVIHPYRNLPATHDILYCEKGGFEILLNGIPHLMQADDCLILHGGIEHYGRRPCAPNTELDFIHLSVAPCDAFREDEPPARPSCLKIAPLVHCQSSPEIKRLFREIIRLFWDELTKTPDHLLEKNIPLDFWINSPSQNKAAFLCNQLFYRLSEISQTTAETMPDIVRTCICLIERNPNRFLSSEEMAKMVFVSERTLRNAFKEACDLTPQQFQRRQKLNYAVALMKEKPKASIKEIAESVGFLDEAYFCKVFKARFGCSPAAYRDLGQSSIHAPEPPR